MSVGNMLAERLNMTHFGSKMLLCMCLDKIHEFQAILVSHGFEESVHICETNYAARMVLPVGFAIVLYRPHHKPKEH